MSLQFHTITLKNFRQYSGEQVIDLACPDQSRINVLEGQNGAGKSNLLNAITLCFYGKEEHNGDSDNENEEEKLPYVSQEKLSNLNPGDSASGYIEITLGYEEPRYRFKREFETYVTDNGEFEDVRDELTLRRWEGRNWKIERNPNTYMTQILPATVSDYFLFDGEDLEGFFSENYPSNVEDAILDVSHTKLLERSIDHLNKVERQLEKDASSAEGKAGEINDEIEAFEAELDTLEGEKEEAEDNLEDTESHIRKVRQKMADVSDEDVRNLYNNRDDLEDLIKSKEQRTRNLRGETSKLMLEAGPAVFAFDAIEFTAQEFSEQESRGELPPKIRQWFIEELLEEGRCICGSDIDEEHTHDETVVTRRKKLKALRKEMPDASEEGLEGKTKLPSILQTAENKVAQIQQNRQLIADLDDEVDDHKQRLQDINSQLKAYELPDDDVDVGSLEDQLERLKDQKTTLTKHIGSLETDIEEVKAKLKQTRKEYQRELDKLDRYRAISAQIEFVQDARDEVQQIKDYILNQIRNETEDNLEQYFNTLIWKEEDYEVILNDDYSIEVLDPHGDNKIGSLSAGETQVLALSFMAALAQISGFDAPVVIDTPLGRISSEPRKRIAQNLPQYLEDTQLTFLMTDEEYTDTVRSLMKSSIANEHDLQFKKGSTEVIPRV